MTKPLTVLVVDDDPVVRETAVHLFQSLGFEVLDAYNGPDVLRLVRHNPRISLLFTDVRMPRMDGVSLAEVAQAIRPDLKVVFTSGYVDSKALPPHAPFVPKPWSTQDLASAVAAIHNDQHKSVEVAGTGFLGPDKTDGRADARREGGLHPGVEPELWASSRDRARA